MKLIGLYATFPISPSNRIYMYIRYPIPNQTCIFINWELSPLSYNVFMEEFIVFPVLFGVMAWYMTNLLADILPYAPEKGPLCEYADCRAAIPVRDYLLLRRCPICGRQRRARTWILLVVMLAASLYLWLLPPKGIGYPGGIIVFTYLTTVAYIDLEHHLILRPLSLAGVILGGITGFMMQGWKSMLLGAVAGFIILFFFYLFGKLFDRIRARRLGTDAVGDEALGSGDVTLAIILGLMVGWPFIWFNILLGILCAGAVSIVIILWLVFTKHYGQKAFAFFIPLGPGFILATMLILYFPSYLAVIVP